ncbi:disease resistance protein RPV1-like [Quercus suber]|uniref:disease resistance protein RPV1-like n=1 Tax=Quercus suber TaxID=58331 RepID=UPI000CE23E1B|nr:TMV resistance protein N-like [Quercus suber]
MTPSFAPSSSTSALRYEYEVFVSFCGEDTRTSFTCHLFAALDRKRICACRGEFNGTELMKAIETARMAVVVFSKSYATSDRCLDELAKIMECNRVLNQRVFPIFYNVSPSEMREQKGNFEEAANLAGFDLKANRDIGNKVVMDDFEQKWSSIVAEDGQIAERRVALREGS